MPEKKGTGDQAKPTLRAKDEFDFACVVLCGGTSSRFGRDKMMAKMAGRPIVSYVIDAFSAMGGELALNVTPQQVRDHPQYEKYGLPFIEDMSAANIVDKDKDKHGKLGPLAGIHSALKWGQEQGRDTVLIWPGDTPFIPLSWPQKMIDYAAEVGTTDNPTIIIAQSKTGKHYVCGLWPTKLATPLKNALKQGHRSIRRYLNHCQDEGAEVNYLSFDDEIRMTDADGKTRSVDGFFNINTRDDLVVGEQVVQESA